jgi:hypothetical protein
MLWISEAFIDRTRNARYGDREPYETRFDSAGELYRWLVKEYGRCTGKVYVDVADRSRQVGWVFISRQPYEDRRTQMYLREVWVTLHDGPDIVTRTEQYHYL